ncbi:MAG: hypothetical protein ACRDRH_12790 [Pseudonocardia sp.]
MIIYGVHSYAWGHVGEIELLTAHHNAADGYAERRSTEYWAANFAVTSRELEKAGSLRVLSEWRNGEKTREPKGHDGHGEWRKTRHVD